MERVIEGLGRWQAAGCTVVPVAINISAMQLQCSDVPETISRMTARHGVSSRMLQVELTESAVPANQCRRYLSGAPLEPAARNLTPVIPAPGLTPCAS